LPIKSAAWRRHKLIVNYKNLFKFNQSAPITIKFNIHGKEENLLQKFFTSTCLLCPSKQKGFKNIDAARLPADLTTLSNSIAVI
jgi:hypothetical protein